MFRRPLPRSALLPAAALPVTALIGAVLALSFPAGQPGEGSREVRFVREMTGHHAQAVDMATRIRERSRERTLRSVALDITLSQQEQIGQMRGWLTLWGLPWGGVGMTAEHARMMGMATPEELQRLDTLPVNEAEKLFLQLMIRHHQGALSMVEPVLKAKVRPEVRRLARQISGSQAGEIRLMTGMLRARGAQPLPFPPGQAGTPGQGGEMGGEHEH